MLDFWRWNADAELLRAYAAELDAKLSLALDQARTKDCPAPFHRLGRLDRRRL